MKKITQLVKTMKPREVRALRKYFAINSAKGDNLKIKLFDLARQNPNLSDREAIEKLGKKNGAGFSMLKSRLQNDILRIIIYEYDISLTSSKFFQGKFRCRRLILEAEVMSVRGLMGSFEEKMNKAAAIARKYHLNHELVLINSELTDKLRMTKNLGYLIKLNQRSKKELDAILARMKAGEFFRQITLPVIHFANKKKLFKEQSERALIEIQAIMNNNDSVWVKYLYLRGQYVHNYISNKFNIAEKYAIDFLDLIKNNIVFNSDTNNFGANYQLSTIYIYTSQFKKSIRYSDNASKFIYETDLAFIQLQENYFLAYWYQKKLEYCEKIISSVKILQSYKPGNLFYSKFIFYEANLKFLQGKHKEALNYLRRHNSLFKDKSGYRIGIKMLEILCIIEMQHYDLLEYRLEALRKLFSSIRSENITRPSMVLQILRTLTRDNFDYEKTNKRFIQEIKLLKAGEDDYRWDAFGYEIVRFDEWWQSKLKPVKVK